MSGLKKLLAKLFALWAFILFTLTVLMVIIPIALTQLWPEPKRSKLLQKVFQVWMKVFFTLTGVRRIFKGRENFRKGETYVVVCNHNSFLDPPLSSPGIPGANRTIAKVEMSRIPIFGIIYKSGSVLVDRKSDDSRKQSYAKMKEVLMNGMHMCIYPEGTRNKSNEPLQKFHDGAFRLAADTGKRIIPSLLFNTRKVLPTKGFCFWPHKVEMHFLPPVDVKGKSVQELKEEVFQLMKQYYINHRN